MTVRTIESDICILGAGISGILAAQKIKRNRPELTVSIVDAGRPIFDSGNRGAYRERYLRYGENPWPNDYVDEMVIWNGENQTMAVGGWALHWHGISPRCSSEELRLRSLYNVAVDWPLSWEELEKHYGEAERLIGVSGESSPYPEDQRSEPYPMPAVPPSYTHEQIKRWAEKSGLKLNSLAHARNSVPYDDRSPCMRCDTCSPICPTGARYSPDYTIRRLVDKHEVDLHSRVLIRRLVPAQGSNKIESATGVVLETGEPIAFRAKTFVLAFGKYWTPHVLLLSATTRFPNGLANSSGVLGRFYNSYGTAEAVFRLDEPIYTGMHDINSMEAREFYRCSRNEPYLRCALWFNATPLGRPKLSRDNGDVLIGDELLAEWRKRSTNLASMYMRYDLHGTADKGLTLDPERRNKWGDPLPKIEDSFDADTSGRNPRVMKHLDSVAERLTKFGGGTFVSKSIHGGPGSDKSPYERAGGCRISDKPSDGVCDSHGRTFDHDNLFIMGGPTTPTMGVGGFTLMHSALTMRYVDEIIRTV